MTPADRRTLDDARLARHRAAWVTPPEPRPDADPAEWERWRRACARQAELLEAEAYLLDHPYRPPERPRWFRAELERHRRPLLAPVPREVRPLEPVDERQMGLFVAPERREEAA